MTHIDNPLGLLQTTLPAIHIGIRVIKHYFSHFTPFVDYTMSDAERLEDFNSPALKAYITSSLMFSRPATCVL
jgi:hypothetical protein